MFNDLVLAQRGILRNNELPHRFSGMLIRNAYGSRFGNIWVLYRHRFHFVRIHIEPGHDDHVFLAVLDIDVALLVDQADVTRSKESIFVERGFGFVGTVPIPGADLWPAHTNFADFADVQIDRVVMTNRDLGGGNRQTDGTGEITSVQRVD